MKLTLESISLELQSSEALDQVIVYRYVGEMRAGATVEPIVVYRNGAAYVLADGFHRIAAAKLLKIDEIEVTVGKESLSDLREEWQEYLIEMQRDQIEW